MIRMKDALPDIPEMTADEHLEAKIRHGQMLTAKDLIGPDGTQIDCQVGDYLKIVDREQDLVAIVEPNKTAGRLTYSCVFPRRETLN
jgi:hypothetical protein